MATTPVTIELHFYEEDGESGIEIIRASPGEVDSVAIPDSRLSDLLASLQTSYVDRIAALADVPRGDVRIAFCGPGEAQWSVELAVQYKHAKVHKHGWCTGHGDTIDDAARDAINFRDYQRAQGKVK